MGLILELQLEGLLFKYYMVTKNLQLHIATEVLFRKLAIYCQFLFAVNTGKVQSEMDQHAFRPSK